MMHGQRNIKLKLNRVTCVIKFQMFVFMKEQLSPHTFGVLMNQELLSSLVCIMLFYFKYVIHDTR